MQEYFWEARLKNGNRLREGLHSFSSVTKDNLERLILAGKDIVHFDMADGRIYVNLQPVSLTLNERDLFGRPDEFFTYKNAEVLLTTAGFANRITQYNIGYSRQAEEYWAKFTYSLPVGGTEFLELEIAPAIAIRGNLRAVYCGRSTVFPVDLQPGQTWRMRMEMKLCLGCIPN